MMILKSVSKFRKAWKTQQMKIVVWKLCFFVSLPFDTLQSHKSIDDKTRNALCDTLHNSLPFVQLLWRSVTFTFDTLCLLLVNCYKAAIHPYFGK